MYSAYQAGQFSIRLAGALLVFAMRHRRPNHCGRQLARGAERRQLGVDPAGQSCRDLLQQPHVAVGVAEGGA
jgi:hypothetical protein